MSTAAWIVIGLIAWLVVGFVVTLGFGKIARAGNEYDEQSAMLLASLKELDERS